MTQSTPGARERSPPAPAPVIADLLAAFAQPGRLVWIGLRPARRAAMLAVTTAAAEAGRGLAGDHYHSRDGQRQVTLIQAEHLAVIGALLGTDPIDPARLRRNLVVAGINLAALRGCRFQIGPVLLEGSGNAPPCSRMEQELGRGGYNAVRGHGGITARIIKGGPLCIGDPVHCPPVTDRHQ